MTSQTQTETLASPALPPRLAAFNQKARGRAVLLVALLEVALFATAAATTYLLPARADIEWIVFVVVTLLCLFFSVLLRAAQHQHDETRETWLSAILIGLGALGYLQRVWFAYHGALLDEPGIYAFRPILAFLPFIALATVTLVRAPTGVKLIWGLWALTALVSLSGLAMHEQMSWRRDDVAVTLMWILLACPIFLLLLNTIPLLYENVLRSSRAELEQVKATAVIAEQLRTSEQRFRMAVKGLQVGIWEHTMPTETAPGRWWCSERFYQLLGYRPGELDLSSENLLNQIEESQRETITQLAKQSLKDDDGFSMDLKIRVKNRRYRSFNVMAHWGRDAQGRPDRLTGSISDIHDRVQAESALLSAKTELQRLAYSDPLTDVSNRRVFDERLNLEIARAHRTGQPLSLLIIDLDHFKLYNDHHGHLSGDESLRTVSTLLQGLVHRPADLLARIGGEEFAVLLPETSGEGAHGIAEQMLQGVYDLNLTHENSPFGRITCSIGIACASNHETTATLLFETADKALYEAKRSRNRICVGSLAVPDSPA